MRSRMYVDRISARGRSGCWDLDHQAINDFHCRGGWPKSPAREIQATAREVKARLEAVGRHFATGPESPCEASAGLHGLRYVLIGKVCDINKLCPSSKRRPEERSTVPRPSIQA